MLKTITILFAIICIAQSAKNEWRQYKVSVKSLWTEKNYPDSYPSNPHFSPGVYGVSMFGFTPENSNGFATEGLKIIAETGATSTLKKEFEESNLMDMDTVGTTGLIENANNNNKHSFTAVVHECNGMNYSYVHWVSMIAPSPDWYVDVELDLDYLYEQNRKNGAKQATLFPAMDSGTDSGTTYTSPDEPTNPAVKVFNLYAAGDPLFTQYDQGLVIEASAKFMQKGEIMDCSTFSVADLDLDSASSTLTFSIVLLFISALVNML